MSIFKSLQQCVVRKYSLKAIKICVRFFPQKKKTEQNLYKYISTYIFYNS